MEDILLGRNTVLCVLIMMFSTCLAITNGKVVDNYITEETMIFSKIFHNYHSSVRPVQKESEVVQVEFGISLQEIRELDPSKGILYTHVWLNYEWKDFRLAWNESQFGGVKSIRVDTKSLWLPDILPYNGKVTYTSTQNMAVVYSSGLVSLVPIVDLATSCSVDLTKFPYDKQICSMKFGSWTYAGNKMNLTLLWPNLDLSSFHSGLYNLVNHTAVKHEFVYACCPEPYMDLTYTLTMKRVSTHSTHMLVAPSITLALLLPVLFLLPPDSSEKLLLGAGLLITHAMLLSIFSSVVPIQHYTLPLLGVFHVINIILVCFAIACATIIRNLWAKSHSNVHMPNIIRTVFLGIFGRLFCVSQNDFISKEKEGSDPKDQDVSDKDHNRLLESSSRAIATAQWRQLTVIVDRICFIIYVLIAVIIVIRFAAY